MRKAVFILLLLLILPIAVAHQPRIVFDRENSRENPIIIQNPEISQVFYGELKGEPDFYLLKSPKDFDLRLGLLAPDISFARTDFLAGITKDGQSLAFDGGEFEWQPYFEPFGRDRYLEGPIFNAPVTQGEYYILITNKENQGKYALAVGFKESFSPKEAVNTVLSMPKLKTEFFEKPAYTAFLNPIGAVFLTFLLIALVIFLSVFSFLKKPARKGPSQKEMA
jgi:hypothetical protein